MVTIGSKVTVTIIAITGRVTGFYTKRVFGHDRVAGVYAQTDGGRVPVRLTRGTAYKLADGTVGTITV